MWNDGASYEQLLQEQPSLGYELAHLIDERTASGFDELVPCNNRTLKMILFGLL